MPWALLNTLRPRQNGRHFADDIFQCIFLNEDMWISISISLKFVPKGQINNIPALIQIMAWRRPGDKPLSEPMLVILLTHICVTLPQWVVVRWMPQNTFNDKSTLVQVMAWCRQATSHYPSQCWPRSFSSCSVTRPRWVNIGMKSVIQFRIRGISCIVSCTCIGNNCIKDNFYMAIKMINYMTLFLLFINI